MYKFDDLPWAKPDEAPKADSRLVKRSQPQEHDTRQTVMGVFADNHVSGEWTIPVPGNFYPNDLKSETRPRLVKTPASLARVQANLYNNNLDLKLAQVSPAAARPEAVVVTPNRAAQTQSHAEPALTSTKTTTQNNLNKAPTSVAAPLASSPSARPFREEISKAPMSVLPSAGSPAQLQTLLSQTQESTRSQVHGTGSGRTAISCANDLQNACNSNSSKKGVPTSPSEVKWAPALGSGAAPPGCSRMVFCWCCGRQYSLMSLPKHIKQCPAQRKLNYKCALPKELRPPMPNPPSTPCPPLEATQAQIDAWNKDAFKIYLDHLAMCFQCGKRFEPDRLEAHRRGCHATGRFSYAKPPPDVKQAFTARLSDSIPLTVSQPQLFPPGPVDPTRPTTCNFPAEFSSGIRSHRPKTAWETIHPNNPTPSRDPTPQISPLLVKASKARGDVMSIYVALDAALPWQNTPEAETRRKQLFARMDPNGNGFLSLAELDLGMKRVLKSEELFASKPVMLRAFNAAKNVRGSQTGKRADYIEFTEFRTALWYLRQYFEYWMIFNRIDSSDDRRIDYDEFVKALPYLTKCGVVVKDSRKAFAQLDADGAGMVLFDEFCNWAIQETLDADDDDDATALIPLDRQELFRKAGPGGNRTATKAVGLERKSKEKQHVEAVIYKALDEKLPWQATPGAERKRKQIFHLLDANGNGMVSLAELDRGIKLIVNFDDLFSVKPVILRAFNAAKHASAKSGEAAKAKNNGDYVELGEFRHLLWYLRQYFEYWTIFDRIDSSDDRRISFAEFQKAVPYLKKCGVTVVNPRKVFDLIDSDGHGMVLFDEFCNWAIQEALDADDDDNAASDIQLSSQKLFRGVSVSGNIAGGGVVNAKRAAGPVPNNASAGMTSGGHTARPHTHTQTAKARNMNR
jgi:Ca2+-binding EF-hand superfamily protein